MPFRTSHPMRCRRFVLLLAALALLLTAGCTLQEYPQSTMTPRSDYAQHIQDLLESLTFWVVVIFVVTQGLLVYAIVRFRARPGAPEPKHVHGNTVLEIAWTIAPALILAAVAVPTVLTIYKTQAAPPANALVVKAVGHQWWWEFQYPAEGVTTGSEMHVPVGRPIAVEIESADVMHSFWFPAMGGKRDAIPAHTNHMIFTPDSVGTYLGQCAELCGLQHANMHMKLYVMEPADFEAWVAAQKAPPAEPDSGSVAFEGRQIFSESACVGCHTIDGVAAGTIGPNLNHVASRSMIAGAMYENSADHLAKWIAEPEKMKPGTLMLNVGLTPDQVTRVVAYLQSLK